MRKTILLASLVIVIAAPVTARTWWIQADGLGEVPNIATGVDSASPGDTLLLGPGAYVAGRNRNIEIFDSIVIRSTDGPEATVIDCMRLDRAFAFSGPQESVLEGVSIVNSWTETFGIAPISALEKVTLRVSNCIFRDNIGGEAGVIRGRESYITVENCTLLDNYGLFGPAAISSSVGSLDVRNCWLEANESRGSSVIAVFQPVLQSRIENNTFVNNTHSQGGTINLTASFDRGFRWTARCANNTIVGTTAHPSFSGAIKVGGMFNLVEYNVVAFNDTKAFYCQGESNPALVRCNLMYENTRGNALCNMFVGGGNVVASPFFYDLSNNDFRPIPSSPAAPNNNTCNRLYGSQPLAGTAASTDSPLANHELLNNHPNPFNPQTTIQYRIAGPAEVTLDIYSVTGQLVKRFARAHGSGGTHAITWDGRDQNDRPVASGVYVYRLTAPGFVQSKKMVLLK